MLIGLDTYIDSTWLYLLWELNWREQHVAPSAYHRPTKPHRLHHSLYINCCN